MRKHAVTYDLWFHAWIALAHEGSKAVGHGEIVAVAVVKIRLGVLPAVAARQHAANTLLFRKQTRRKKKEEKEEEEEGEEEKKEKMMMMKRRREEEEEEEEEKEETNERGVGGDQ